MNNKQSMYKNNGDFSIINKTRLVVFVNDLGTIRHSWLPNYLITFLAADLT